jgi:hypothetical protein
MITMMKFSYSTHVLCSCGLGQKCPDVWRKDGSWNSRHGSAGWAARIPTSGGTKALKRYGYPSKSAAEQAAKAVGALIDLTADDATRARIGDMIASAKRGAELPGKAVVARRLGLNLDPASPGVTMAEWLDSWLAGKARAKRASTYRGYESHVRVHILPVIGELPLERVNTGHVEAVLAAVPGSAGTRHRAAGHPAGGAQRRREAAPDHAQPVRGDRAGTGEPGRGEAVDASRGGPVPRVHGG